MHNRRELQEKQKLYGSLHKILTALKALAYIETHRLQEKLTYQQAITERMQNALLTLQRSAVFQVDPHKPPICVVLGTERGFCGDINARLLAHCVEQQHNALTHWVLVGMRLIQYDEAQQNSLANQQLTGLAGATVMEDCEQVIDRLVDIVSEEWQQDDSTSYSGIAALSIVYLSSSSDQVQCLEVFGHATPDTADHSNDTPMLYRPAAVLLQELLPLYLFSVLQSCLTEALLSENRKRLQHLDNAVHHLSDKSDALTLSANRLRQAQIIADIEVLLGVTPDDHR